MKSRWLAAGLVGCLSTPSMAADEVVAEVTQAVTSAALAQITSVGIDAVSIGSDGVKVQRSADGVVVPGLQAVPTSCAPTDADIYLKKDDNPYFREQFSALLTSHKLKQPVDLTVFDEGGACLIEAVTVRR